MFLCIGPRRDLRVLDGELVIMFGRHYSLAGSRTEGFPKAHGGDVDAKRLFLFLTIYLDDILGALPLNHPDLDGTVAEK